MTNSSAGPPDQYADLRRFDNAVGELVEAGYFRPGVDVFINRTPGRLDLMGGNDDYTGGLVFETTIREATLVAVQPRGDRKVVFLNPGVTQFGWQERVELSLDDFTENGHAKDVEAVRTLLQADPARAWCAYVAGDLYFLIKQFPQKVVYGFSLYLQSDVPLGKGVSSSAALEVAPMKAMAHMYGIDVGGVELASWAQWVEIALTQAGCGIMDQLAVTMGDEDQFVPMLCEPCQPYQLVRLPSNLRVWGLDSGVRHSVAGLEYESARAATFLGYSLLCHWERLEPTLDETGILPRWVEPRWQGYLARVSPSEFRTRYEERLPECLRGADFVAMRLQHLDPFSPVRPEVVYPVRAATRYAVEENVRVTTFYRLVAASAGPVDEMTAGLLGELMYQSHVGYTQCGLGSAATDKIVELVRSERNNGLIGAKITGGGAGGTVAILGLDSTAAASALKRVVERYSLWSKTDPYLFEGSSAGCDKFGVLQRTYGRQ